MSERLPSPDFDIDCETADGTPAISPGWEFRVLTFFGNIAAYRDSIVLDGDQIVDGDGPELLDLERDALAILAAIEQHRAWVAEDEL